MHAYTKASIKVAGSDEPGEHDQNIAIPAARAKRRESKPTLQPSNSNSMSATPLLSSCGRVLARLILCNSEQLSSAF
jgi:hypothetical protein